MTTLQLAQRLTRFLTHRDVRTLTADDLQLLLDAVNAGLGEYVEFLPELRRAEPRSSALAVPLEKTITATADSATIAFSPSFAGQTANYGQSAIVGNDSGRYNRLAGLNSLLAPHRGSTGTTTLTLYSDAVQFGQYDDAVSGEVTLVDGSNRLDLTHGKPADWVGYQPPMLQLGRPRHWWMEPLNGMTALNAPLYLLRVWPAPVAAYDLLYSLRLFPTAVTFDDIQTPRQLPVPASEEAALVNLCAPGLFVSRLWDKEVSKEDVRDDYNRSRSAMESKLDRRGNTQRGRIGTRRGF